VVVDGSDDFSATSKWALFTGNVWFASSVTWSPLQVFADGARLASSTATPSDLPPGSFSYVTGQGLYVNVGGDNPGVHQAHVGHRSHGFKVSGKPWVTILGFTVTRTEDRGIYLSSAANNCVISNNAVTFANGRGIGITASTGVRVLSNVVSDSQNHGISLAEGSDGGTVQDNESFRNSDPIARRANGIYIGASSNILIQRNRLHDNQDSGLNYSLASNNNISISNLSWTNGDHGFDHLDSSTGSIHRNDVAYGNFKDGFSIEGGATGTSLYNCIAVDNGNGVYPYKLPPTPREFDLWVENTSTAGFVSDDNLFWNSNSVAPVKYATTIYSTVAAYSAAAGNDSHSIQSDPRFVAPAAGDFHLLAGSPAIDNGNSAASNWPATDAEGRARVDDPATPNIGVGPPVSYSDRGA